MQITPAMLDNLELIARQVVEGFIIGLHKSPFHGFSVEFAEHRLYNAGDPLRYIDWRVYGRTDKMFIKRFEEETNLRCTIAIDTSSSMFFPKDKARMSKEQFSVLCAAAIMQLLKRQLDAAGLAFFDAGLRELIAARSAPTHYRNLIRRLENLLAEEDVQGRPTNAAAALHTIADSIHRRSLVVIFSDMLDDAADAENLLSALQHLKYNKHEVILFHVMDKAQEVDFSFEQRPYEFVGMENGERIRLQPQQIREQYIKGMSAFRKLIEDKCHQYGIDRVEVDLTDDVNKVLHAFLLKRQRMQ